jgi:hypothetical protein
MYNTNGDLFHDGWRVRSAGGNIFSPSLLPFSREHEKKERETQERTRAANRVIP